MDNLWQEIQPAGSGEGGGSGFDLTILTPVDSGHPSAEQLEHQQRLQQQAAAGGRPGAKQEPVYVGKPRYWRDCPYRPSASHH